jgi:hypothetical protein
LDLGSSWVLSGLLLLPVGLASSLAAACMLARGGKLLLGLHMSHPVHVMDRRMKMYHGGENRQ